MKNACNGEFQGFICSISDYAFGLDVVEITRVRRHEIHHMFKLKRQNINFTWLLYNKQFTVVFNFSLHVLYHNEFCMCTW